MGGDRRGPTLELGLFLGLVGLAFLLRTLRLDLQPLAPQETARALVAWQLASGQTPEWWDAPAACLATLISFLLLGATEATARLPSALAGTGLVAALWLFRGWLGRWPVLLSAALVAISPSALATSRMAGEESMAALLTLLLGWGMIQFWEAPSRRSAVLGSVGAAVLLHLGYAGVSGALFLLLFGAALYALRPSDSAGGALRGLRPRELLLLFLMTFLAMGGGLLLFPAGVGFSSLLAWLRHFDLPPDGLPWPQTLLILGGYELPALAIGVPASLVALRRWPGRPLDTALAGRSFLGLWGLLGLLFYLLGGVASPGASFLASLPLTIVAGAALAAGAAELKDRDWRMAQGPALLALTLLGFGAITLSQAAQSAAASQGPGAPLGLVALALTAASFGMAALSAPRPRAVAAAAALCATLVLTLHSSARLTLSSGWPGVLALDRDGVAVVAEQVGLARYTQQGRQQEILVEQDLRPAVAWYLREAPRLSPSTGSGLRYAPQVGAGPGVILAREEAVVEDVAGYQRRVVPLGAQWTPRWGEWRALARWLLAGEASPDEVSGRRMVLWVRS
ncbi:MAG: glycosyltransferase family 39 protein [Chloroflexi bacterium]|nr:glycosyltransferase family 39 protein [Chloroflexota bacterium]